MRNKYGWSDWSDETVIVAAKNPENDITIETDYLNTFLKLTWTTPDPNGGTIDAYEIQIKQSDNDFSQEETYCNGLNSQVIEN